MLVWLNSHSQSTIKLYSLWINVGPTIVHPAVYSGIERENKVEGWHISKKLKYGFNLICSEQSNADRFSIAMVWAIRGEALECQEFISLLWFPKYTPLKGQLSSSRLPDVNDWNLP